MLKLMNIRQKLRPKNTDQFPWKLAGVLYFVAWGPSLLFLKARFWDDWAIYFSMTPTDQKNYWRGEGFPPYVHEVLNFLFRSSPVAYHLTSLAIYFCLGWLLFQILQKTKICSPEIIQRVCLIFIILPINSARNAMIILPYSVSILLFFLAWNMLLSKNRLILCSSFIVFVSSFYTASVIPFFMLPIANFVYLEWKKTNRITRKVIRKSLLILLAPAYYLLIARIVWPPAEHRTAYFSPQLIGLIRALILILVLASVSFFLIRKSLEGKIPQERTILLSFGMMSLGFGSIAYFASGRLVDLSEWISFFVPRSSSWDSRSQLLHGLGFALILGGVIGALDTYLKVVGYRVVVAICLILNFTFSIGYYVDYLKQESLMQSFRQENLEPNSVIMIRDNTNQFNARGRNLRSYEWEAMIFKATGLKKTVIDEAFVNCSPHAEVPDLFITVNPGWGRLSTLIRQDAGMEVSYDEIAPCKKSK
jgi:hypothetical protein